MGGLEWRSGDQEIGFTPRLIRRMGQNLALALQALYFATKLDQPRSRLMYANSIQKHLFFGEELSSSKTFAGGIKASHISGCLRKTTCVVIQICNAGLNLHPQASEMLYKHEQ
eukprot:scaffold37245_cov18-Tisochrysis_lutea.AAC.1